MCHYASSPGIGSSFFLLLLLLLLLSSRSLFLCLKSIAYLFTALFLQVSCGEYTTNYVKDYNIFVQSEDDEINDTIRALADQYNNDFGAEAISIVDDEDDSNSRIGFISGLKSRENKLGLGQWITMTSEEGRDLVPSASGSNLQKTVVYSMELAFDLQNFRQKMSSRETRSGATGIIYITCSVTK